MAGFVDSTVKEIDDRLQELKEEASRLEAARSALVGARRGAGRPRAAGTAGRARRRTTGARPGRPRGRSGTRGAQALELVRGQPGITIPQIAEKMGIEPNYLYRVLPRLADEGKVRRDGQGWHPAE